MEENVPDPDDRNTGGARCQWPHPDNALLTCKRPRGHKGKHWGIYQGFGMTWV